MAQVKETHVGSNREILVSTWIIVTEDGEEHLEMRWVPSHQTFEEFVATLPAAA